MAPETSVRIVLRARLSTRKVNWWTWTNVVHQSNLNETDMNTVALLDRGRLELVVRGELESPGGRSITDGEWATNSI